MEKITRGGRKLHNEELHDLYSLPNIIRVIMEDEVAGCVAHMVVKRNVYRVLVRKCEGKRPLEELGIDGRATFKCKIKRGWK
jgi:hypothetical protein